MWSQDSLNKRQKTTESASQEFSSSNFAESQTQADSGFLSATSGDSSMKGCATDSQDLELGESLICNLSLRHSGINNLERTRIQRQQQHQSEPICNEAGMNRLNVKWSEVERIEQRSDISKQPYEFFFRQDCEGDTQLHLSIALNHLEASFWLIELAPHPCLLDIANDESHTALHLSVMAREPRITRRLVLAGAKLGARTAAGNTALHLACALGDLGCVRALSESITDLETSWLAQPRPRNGQPEVDTAAVTNGRTVVLPQNLELRNNVGKTCLHIAASKGHLDLVHHLVNSGAEVDTQEGLGGKTALHLAIENSHRQVVHYLAQEHRSCLDAVTYAGATAYQLAVDVDLQLAEDLLSLGASPVMRHCCDDSDSCESCCGSSGTSSSGSGSDDDEPDCFAPHAKTFSRMGLGQSATAVSA